MLLLGLATRGPLVGAYLANWDAVQYALGMAEFDVTRHQPHPPGSLLYVALGRALLGLTGDPQRALGLISVLGGSVSLVLCAVVGRMLFGWRIAVAGTLLYATSPLTWYYGGVALPYALEGALVLGLVALLWPAAEERRPASALAAAAVLAVAGGVRPTTMLLLLPLWLFATWRACALPAPLALRAGRVRLSGTWPSARRGWLWLLAGLALLGALCLAWAVPLLVLSGGPGVYATASRRLSSLVSELTSVFVVGLPAVAWNVQYLIDVSILGLNLALVPLLVFLLPGRRWPWRPSASQAVFLALWAGPALVVFVALHVGQAGYLLLLWPLVCYAAGTAALVAGEEIGRRWPALGRRASSLLLGALAASGIAIFLFSPLLAGGSAGLTLGAVREHDREWRSLTALAEEWPEQEGQVALLTGTHARESFRLATYYLPHLHVYAIGLDRDGDLGIAFQGYEGEHSYAGFMAGEPAAQEVALPAGTRRLLILDEGVARLFPEGSLQEVPLTPWRSVWLWPATPPTQHAGSTPPTPPSAPDLTRLEVRSPLHPG
ncbi:MAG TPA: glycosyltransferase family 39 protein [Chloroflexota bacterium]|nr:glycosyltransferase family 39 protein [Chloroflexota bacterium]